MRYLTLLLMIVALSGCASYERQRRDNNLATWKGSTEAEVIEGLGIPDQTYSVGKTKYLEYGGTADYADCVSRLAIEKGIVVKTSVTGEECYPF